MQRQFEVYKHFWNWSFIGKPSKFHKRMKLIHIRHHLIGESLKNGQIDVNYVSTEETGADFLTKALPSKIVFFFPGYTKYHILQRIHSEYVKRISIFWNFLKYGFRKSSRFTIDFLMKAARKKYLHSYFSFRRIIFGNVLEMYRKKLEK